MIKTETVYKHAKHAAAAARKALGSDAKPTLDYLIVQVEGGYVWRVKDGAATAEPPTSASDVPVSSEKQIDERARKSLKAPNTAVGTPGECYNEMADLITTGKSFEQIERERRPSAVVAKSVNVADLHKSDDPIAKENRESWPTGSKRREIKLVPKSRKLHAASPFSLANAKSFVTVETWGKRTRVAYKTLHEAAAAAYLTREGNPGKDVLVLALNEEGYERAVSRDDQRIAAADYITATAKEKTMSRYTKQTKAAARRPAKPSKKTSNGIEKNTLNPEAPKVLALVKFLSAWRSIEAIAKEIGWSPSSAGWYVSKLRIYGPARMKVKVEERDGKAGREYRVA
jgi:hypothetical protein